MDRHLLGLVQALGGLPRAEDQEGRWRVGIHARTTRAGPQQCEPTHRSRGVVHPVSYTHLAELRAQLQGGLQFGPKPQRCV